MDLKSGGFAFKALDGGVEGSGCSREIISHDGDIEQVACGGLVLILNQ